MAYKNAKSLLELEKMAETNSLFYIDNLKEEYISNGLYIPTLTMEELQLDPARCGIIGSPTKVLKVESVVLAGGEHEIIEPTKKGISQLIDKLREDRIFG